MKKSLLFVGSIPLVSLPIIVISSCSTTGERVDLHGQYNLFTPELVKQEQVSKNLLLSINTSNVSNIYSTPKNLLSEIDFVFSFDVNKEANSLILYVQIYDYKGEIVKFSSESDKKEITTIENFDHLPSAEQAYIDDQYSKFMSLSLEGNLTLLPSNINGFESIKGSEAFKPTPDEDKKYNFNYELLPSNEKGEIKINFSLTSKNGYPLNPFESIGFTKNVIGFMTSKTYQDNVDNMYTGANEISSINLEDVKFASVKGKYLASSITTVKELVAFYKILQPLDPDKKINIPCFLEPKPECECLFDSEIDIESYDSYGKIELTIKFYDKITKEQVLPTSGNGISRLKNISGFVKPSKELLKASIDAYAVFEEGFKAKSNKTLPSQNIGVTDISTISNIDIKYMGEFDIMVEKYPADPKKQTAPVMETFTFRMMPLSLQALDGEGVISSKVILEVKMMNGKEFQWVTIKQPSYIKDTEGKITFGSAVVETSLNITGFLTTQNKEVNDLYEKLNTQIKSVNDLVLTTVQNRPEFDSADFESIWSGLYKGDTDPLGLLIASDKFRVQYTISTNPSESTVGNTLYSWVNVKASINSIFSDFEYEFLNINNLPNTDFEFNFAIKLNS